MRRHIQDILPRDAISPIDDPELGTEYFGEDNDEGIVVETAPTQAYPVSDTGSKPLRLRLAG